MPFWCSVDRKIRSEDRPKSPGDVEGCAYMSGSNISIGTIEYPRLVEHTLFCKIFPQHI